MAFPRLIKRRYCLFLLFRTGLAVLMSPICQKPIAHIVPSSQLDRGAILPSYIAQLFFAPICSEQERGVEGRFFCGNTFYSTSVTALALARRHEASTKFFAQRTEIPRIKTKREGETKKSEEEKGGATFTITSSREKEARALFLLQNRTRIHVMQVYSPNLEFDSSLDLSLPWNLTLF